MRRVVCAAIRAADGSVMLGIRHYSLDMHAQIDARSDGKRFHHRSGKDQGFVDQRGVYIERGEAMQVARAAGQLRGPPIDPDQLYSEDLY